MNKQTGSMHIVVLVALVMVLLGILGFIFWQNFIYDKPLSQVDTNAVNSAPVYKKSDRGKLMVDEWGITIPTKKEISYRYLANTKSLKITSTELNNAKSKIGCNEEAGVSVTRMKTSNDDDLADYPADKTSDLNGYTYLLMPGNQAVCVDEKGFAPEEVNTLDEDLYKSLKGSWSKVTITN